MSNENNSSSTAAGGSPNVPVSSGSTAPQVEKKQEDVAGGAEKKGKSPLQQKLEAVASSLEKPAEGAKADKTPQVEPQKSEAEKEDAGKGAAAPKKEQEITDPAELRKLLAQKEALLSQFQSRYDSETSRLSKELEAAQKELKGLQSRIKDYDENPILAIKKHHPQVFENLEAASDVDGYLAKWQKSQLIEDLRKQFPDEVDDSWRYDPAEAYTAGTPSYFYRVRSEEKRQAILGSLQQQKQKEEQLIQTYQKQRDEDLNYLKQTYGYDDSVLQGKLKEFDAIHEKVLNGELPAEKHPFSIRNLFRGVFFEELVAIETQKAAERAKNETIELFKSKGMVLSEKAPTDVSSMTPVSSPATTSQQKAKSPLERKMASFLQ